MKDATARVLQPAARTCIPPEARPTVIANHFILLPITRDPSSSLFLGHEAIMVGAMESCMGASSELLLVHVHLRFLFVVGM
jgi:hypothetical protein